MLLWARGHMSEDSWGVLLPCCLNQVSLYKMQHVFSKRGITRKAKEMADAVLASASASVVWSIGIRRVVHQLVW